MPKPRATPLLDLRVLLHGGAWLEVTLWRESRGALRYRLCYRRGGECLVRYDSARRGGAPACRHSLSATSLVSYSHCA